MGKKTFSCVKWLLTIFNLLFLVCGLAVFGLAIWMLVSPSMVNGRIGSSLAPVVAYILLSCGGCVVLIAFCGCAGAVLENRCLICLFFTVLCGVFVALLVASILVAIFRKELTTVTAQSLSNNLRDNYAVSPTWTEFWDLLQSNLSCCAVDNDNAISAYQRTNLYNSSKMRLPTSCCIKGKGDSQLDSCRQGDKKYINKKGCMTFVMDLLIQEYILMLISLVILVVVLVSGMTLSLVHLRNIINIRYHEYSHPI